jgi:sugar diacid utilization regulator
MTPLSDAITGLRRYGVVPDAALAIDRRALAARLIAAVTKEVGEYRESRDPDVLPGLEAHLGKHVDAVIGLLRLERDFAFGFVSDYAHRCASNKFPLDAVLRAYRCVNRLLADAVRDAAIDVASDYAELRRVVAATAAFVIEYTSAAGSMATTEYVAETRRLAEKEGDHRAELLNLLVDGYDESDARAAALLRRAGYLEQRQTYCVAIVTSRTPSEMEDPARVSRIEAAVAASLSRAPLRRLIGVRDNRVVVVLSATARQSGYTRPHTIASRLALTPLRTLGTAVFAGLSTDVPSTAHIPRALAEAERALEFASLSRRVVEAGSIPFFDMIAHLTRAHARPVLPPWARTLSSADRHGKLAATLEAFAANDMNVAKTAKALDVHANTVRARFDRIEKVTGLSPATWRGLTEMLFALRCLSD